MKIKTSELTGHALNWAVNVAEGFTPVVGINPFGYGVCLNGSDYLDWSQGGPIIEREHISISHYKPSPMNKEPMVIAAISTDYAQEGNKWFEGPTPLIAAMRCYVASVLGDEVDIPEELG